MAKDFNIPDDLFHAKQKEFRNKHQKNKTIMQVGMSDEEPDNED